MTGAPSRPTASDDPTAPYRRAGVDIDAGARLVQAIKPLARGTGRPGAVGELGGFGGLFDLAAVGMRDPMLVAATDGVGTKLKVAITADRHNTVGIDLVAMCVNDLVVQGAEPLFFLDYFACGRLDAAVAETVIGGIAAGCREAGCALIGGETAELPGLYAVGDYDLAGFAVGAVERTHVLTGATVAVGDVVLGLASNGLHANGFSLVRRIVEAQGLRLDEPSPFAPHRSLGEALLEPTRIYVRACLAALRSGGVRALAHITGGGLMENLPRVLPPGTGLRLDAGAWPLPPVFAWLVGAGRLSPAALATTFNAGIGMAAVVDPAAQDAVADAFRAHGETVWRIGDVVAADERRVTIENTDSAWPA